MIQIIIAIVYVLLKYLIIPIKIIKEIIHFDDWKKKSR